MFKHGLVPGVVLLTLCNTHISEAATAVAPIIVTATRAAQTVDETLAAVTVISRDEIEQRQARSIEDLLRTVPGLEISNNGGRGKVSSVFLRGTESDHVLVLVDGIKIGSATSGTSPFENIPVEQIDRIEIVRGPRSSLYGSEAIGGVIQIFTRKGSGTPAPSFSVGAGSDKTYKASAGISAGVGRGWYSLSGSATDTEGFNSCSGNPLTFAGCATTEPDKDGYTNKSAALRAGYRFSNETEIDVHYLTSDNNSEYDGSFQNESDTVQHVLGGILRFSPMNIWDVTLTAGQSRDESDNFLNGVFSSSFDTKRDSITLQNDVMIGANQIGTLGFDYQNDEIESSTAYSVSERDNRGVFAQYQAGIGKNDVQISLRSDDNEQFGDAVTGNAAWGYTFSTALRLVASYGTAFKAPSFNELYFPGFGNPNLDVEESKSTEIGLSGNISQAHWSINAFQTDVDNLIAYDATIFAPANIGKARIRGLEAVFNTRIAEWDLSSNLTLLDPKNLSSGANQDNMLPRRARQNLRILADRSIGQYRFGTTLIAASKRYDNLANTTRLGGYVVVDLRAEYQLSKAWLIQGVIENLLDKDYQTADYYNQPERGFFVTLRYRPANF